MVSLQDMVKELYFQLNKENEKRNQVEALLAVKHDDAQKLQAELV